MSNFWDTELFVNEIGVSDTKRIVIKHVTKGKNKYVDVRQQFKSGNEWKYGKGIAIPYDVALGVGESIVESIAKAERLEEKVFEEV